MRRAGLNPQLVPMVSILLLAVGWQEWELQHQMSAGTPRVVSAAAERLDDREHRAEAAPAPPVGDFAPTPAFAYSFVKFDRKQNTRLWPFVTTGTTRSPPFFL
jgi:hypothetical protein